MTAHQKEFIKSIGTLVTVGAVVVGLIYGTGKFVNEKSNDHSLIIQNNATIETHEKRLQTVETDIAVVKTDSKNMKESIDRVERNTEETNKLIRELLQRKRP